jgi:hypothetical protein
MVSLGEYMDQHYKPPPHPPAEPSSSGRGSYESNGDSVFDRFSEAASWSDIPEPLGWKKVKPADSATLEAWQHPDATHPISAHVLKKAPYVTVNWSENSGLPVGRDQDLTKARVYAWAHYNNDLSAASKALVRGDAVGLPTHVVDAVHSRYNINSTVTEVTANQISGDNGVPAGARKLKATKVSDIRMTATRWLWEDGPHCWIPQGHLVGLGGREGVGKSTVCAHVAAKMTKGELPGDFYGTPKGVIIVSTEDDWSATINPRLVAAGADLDRVFQVNAIEPDGLEGTLSLPADLQRLQEIIREHDVALAILDPLLTLIHKGLDTHKDAEVRRALEPMTRVAHETKVSLIGLVHVNKSNEGDLLNRIMASRALTGVPRAFLFCAKYWQSLGVEDADPDYAALNSPRTEFMFGQIKNNLAAKVMISLRYHMDTEIVGHDDEADKDIRASKLFIDKRPVDQNVEDIVLEQEKARKSVRTQGGQAKQWLVGYLTGEVPSSTVEQDGTAAGHSRSAIQRGRKDLGEQIQVRSFGTVPRTTTWELLPEKK